MRSIIYPTLLLFNGVFVSLGSDSKIIKYVCVVLLFLYLSCKRKRFLIKKYHNINLALCLFCSAILLSSIHMKFLHLPNDFHAVSPFSGVLLVLCVVDTFFFLEYMNETNRIKIFASLMFKLTTLYLIINDIFLLWQMPSVSGKESVEIFYFIGNKFEVAYMHLFFVVFYYLLHCTGTTKKKKYYLFVFISLFAILISYLVECSTGIVGCLALFLLLFSYEKLPFLLKPGFAILLIFIFGAFFIYYEWLLNIPFIQYVIVDVLGEDLTLTGRTYIYARILELLSMQPWLGYGNGSATFFTMYYVHESLMNTQNGLLNDFFDWGIVGVASLLFLVATTMKNLKLTSRQISPFVCLAYTYIILSSIEITLGLRFLAILPFCIFMKQSLCSKER